MKAYVNIQIRIQSLADAVRQQILIHPGVTSCQEVTGGQFDLVAVLDGDQLTLDGVVRAINRISNVTDVDANFVK